jgi:hypothetical protein
VRVEKKLSGLSGIISLSIRRNAIRESGAHGTTDLAPGWKEYLSYRTIQYGRAIGPRVSSTSCLGLEQADDENIGAIWSAKLVNV